MDTTLLTVRPSPSAGQGTFALVPIPAGTLLLSELPLLLLPPPTTTATLASPTPATTLTDAAIDAAVANLAPSALAQFDALADPGTHHASRAVRILRGNAVAYPFPVSLPSTSRNPDTDNPNANPAVPSPATGLSSIRTTTTTTTTTNTGTALYPSLARLNHSCTPNADLAFHPTTRRAEVFALRDVEEGEEVVFSYLADCACMPRSYRRFLLGMNWRFGCCCFACGPADRVSTTGKGGGGGAGGGCGDGKGGGAVGGGWHESDARRARIYELRAVLQGFVLPVLSVKGVRRAGVPLEVFGGVGELGRVLAGLWMPPQGKDAGLGMRGHVGVLGGGVETGEGVRQELELRTAMWKELVSLMQAEGLAGKELAFCYRGVVDAMGEEEEITGRGDGKGDAGGNRDQLAEEVAGWARMGLRVMRECRSPGHPDLGEYEVQYERWRRKSGRRSGED